MAVPSQVAVIFANDEEIAVRAGGDFVTLCPQWQLLASGTDGIFASGSPWVLTSQSNDFVSQGVGTNNVVVMTKPATYFKGGGHILAIDSVTTNSITLRRLATPLNQGKAPVPDAGLSGVEFTIPTLFPQIEEAAFDLYRRFAIDPNVGGRDPASMYDQRDLRQACILTVLKWRYIAEVRVDRGDFKIKLDAVLNELSNLESRLSIRWGASGSDVRSTSWFGTRIVR